ncbi:MAG: UPF0158 family protein [Pseudonocardia sp.]|nr:UPF0158 family protein [Pseudonocardia sp.]
MLDPEGIDLDDLVTALDDRTPEQSWWIHPETGEVVPHVPEACSGVAETVDDLAGAGWVQVLPVEGREGYRDMADFTAGVQHRRAAELLDRAINGRGAFRRFKNTLFEFPEVRDQWYRFRDARSRRRALEWLVDAGLVEREAGARARARYPDPSPQNEDVPAVVAADLASLYGPRLRQVLLFGSWASGEGSVESDLDLLVVLDGLDSPWAELRRMDDVLGQHTERSGITLTALPVSQESMSRPTEPWLVRAKAESVRIR